MTRYLFRAGYTAVVLGLGIAAAAVFAPPAMPNEAAPKGDLALAPQPAEKPQPRPPCAIPFEIVSELAGWQTLTGDKAMKYVAIAFTSSKQIDAIAYAVRGEKAAIVASLNGCVVGRQIIPAKAHAAFMKQAFGIAV